MGDLEDLAATSDVRILAQFVRVAQTGSFSRAAVMLGMTQPALSRHVRALELELKQTLLRRNGRGVELTDAGKTLFEHARIIVAQLDLARRDVASARASYSGLVRIGLPPTMARALTVPLVDGFRRDFPHAEIGIVEALSTHLVEWIKSGHVDVAVVHNLLPSPNIEARPVLEEALCLMSPPGTGSTPAQEVAFEAATQLPLILPERAAAIRRLIDTRATHLGLQVQVTHEISSISGILELVERGYGHTLLPPSALLVQPDGFDLLVRPVTSPRLVCAVSLAWAAQRQASPLFRDASDLLARLAVHAIGSAAASFGGPAVRIGRRTGSATAGAAAAAH